MTTKDGGPAFPSPNEYMPSGDVQYGSYGMTLRDYYIAHAPTEEVAQIIPPSVGEVAEFIGLEYKQYETRKHWPLVLAKARGVWADAMLEERAK